MMMISTRRSLLLTAGCLLLWVPLNVSGFQPSLVLRRPTATELSMVRRGGGMRRRPPMRRVEENKPTMNNQITFPEMRVVTPNPKGKDEPLGIMKLQQALDKAKELGNLDLIVVNDKSDPPVCKIVDYSKYRYMQEKKAKEVKKNSKTSELKEVKMSYKIDVHDYGVRKKAAAKFLRQGDRVKCTVMFRGREVQHDSLGYELLDKLSSELEDTCVREGRPKREGRNLSLILTPRPEVMKQLNNERRAMDKAKKQRKVLAVEEEETDTSETIQPESPKEVVTATKSKADKTLEELLGTDEFF